MRSGSISAPNCTAGEGNYALGGAREGRCREKESFGAEYCETDETRVSGASAIAKAMRVEADAGICSAWQT